MSTSSTVAAALGGDVAVGSHVTVRGWIRSKRDSKAGISFLAVNDGTAFDSIQAVVPSESDLQWAPLSGRYQSGLYLLVLLQGLLCPHRRLRLKSVARSEYRPRRHPGRPRED